MKCEETRSLLSSFVDAELARREQGKVREHLRVCSKCRSEVAAGRSLASLLSVGEVEADPGFVVRFRARRDQALASAWLHQPWKWLAVRLVPLAAAAVVVAALVLGAGGDAADTIRHLEQNELSHGLAQVTEETTTLEPVLGMVFAGGGGR